MKITYLGPAGATFTAIAYDKLASRFRAPKSTDAGVELCYARTNEDVLKLMLQNGGYGAIAMETKAEGRVDPPLNSFIELLRIYDKSCPIQVLGALPMKISFALMAQKGTSLSDIKAIHAHPKSLGACRTNIQKLGVGIVESSSNGKAAEEVSQADSSLQIAALGPLQAAEKYGLEVLLPAFEDQEAVTTFYLLGPGQYWMNPAIIKRSLTVFRVPHVPGALVKTLRPFEMHGINLRLVHSLHYQNGVYDFAIESEYEPNLTDQHTWANDLAHKHMDRWIQFGPFPVACE